MSLLRVTILGPAHARPLLQVAVLLPFALSGVARAADRADGDTLPAGSAALVDLLVSEGMPELVEELIRTGSPAHQVLLARAAARAAELVRDPVRRDADLERAQSAYRAALTVESDPEWSGTARRRLAIAGWRVEAAGLTLRKLCAADLDDFEACSGLRRPPPRLAQRLAAAIRDYRQADATLKEFTSLLARDEDALLMEGVNRSVVSIARRCSLNLAWALVYRAMIAGPQDAEQGEDLHEALRRFDAAGRDAADFEERLSAALGAGIAFRESNRPQDARPILEGIVRTATAEETRARARFELARIAMKAQDFEAAVRHFDELATGPTSAPAEGGGSFYARLAPILASYCRLLRAESRSDDSAAADRKRAIDELVRLRSADPAWAGVVDVYLNQVVPADASPSVLRSADQLTLGRRLASMGEYAQAVAAYESYLARSESESAADRDAARYELVRCLRQTGQLRPAARMLSELADRTSNAALARTAVEELVETWQAVVAAFALRDDQIQLARACLRAAEQAKDAKATDALILEAATNFERAGRIDDAIQAYGRIDATSASFTIARFGAVRCRQTALQQRGAGMPTSEAARSAGAIVREWDELAGQPRPGSGSRTPESDEVRAMRDQAALNAAELMAGPQLRQYAEALVRLDRLDRPDLPAALAVRLISSRLRCHRQLDQLDACDRDVRRLVEWAKAMPPGPGLVAAAAELNAEVERRGAAEPTTAVRQLANDSVPIMGRLLDSVLAEPTRSADLPVVRFGMARMLIAAGRAVEALPLLEPLVTGDPTNGAYLQWHARALEQLARSDGAEPDRRAQAEAAWARVLDDRTLREIEPHRYWEARYHWLRWQLDAGRAAEVAAGIESERAWQPELGGPPWNARLLELAEKARVIARR